MTSAAFFDLVNRAHYRWRDQILTGLTLMTVLYLFVVAPLQGEHVTPLRPLGFLFVLVLAAALVILSRSLYPLASLAVAILLLAAAFVLAARGIDARLDMGLQAMAWLIVGSMIAWVVGRAAFEAGRITYHRVMGAVLLYLAIGLAFVALYTLAGALEPASFNGIIITERLAMPSDLIYFSFATLTTVGYGDIVPLKPLVRSISNVEAIVGQLYPATLLARLVSLGQDHTRS